MKWLSILFVLNVALLFAPSFAIAQGNVSEEFECYDATSDGDVDISDALRLLNWMFLAEQPPDPCVDVVAFCPAAGQDGSIVPGCQNDANRFVDNGDGTVTDTCTGLMWQQETGDADPEPGIQEILWCDALDYAEGLNLGGHGDWRVPDYNELHSIVDHGRFANGLGDFAIDPIFSSLANAYWTSTPLAASNEAVGQEVWAIEFGFGRDGPVFVEAGGVAVRCVRNAGGPSTLPDTGQTACYDNAGNRISCESDTCLGQDGSIVPGCEDVFNRFSNNGDGTVTDTCTGLMWQQASGDPDPTPGLQDLLWCEALDYADTLVLGGHDDWRVPDITELKSIVDRGRFADGGGNFSINPIFDSIANAYWSSTPVALSNPAVGQEAWAVEFGLGLEGPVFVEAGSLTVRCVRNTDGPSTLPDTGQTACYDAAGNAVDCALDAEREFHAEFQCYDANGNDEIDIMDPMTLLFWMFLGEEDPESCPGYIPPCPADGQDGSIVPGCENRFDRFVDNGDGTVTDTCTGLMWQQESGDPVPEAPLETMTWCDAFSYADGLSLGNFVDWRVPDINELKSIVDRGRSNVSIDPAFSAVINAYWSSTPLAESNPEVGQEAWAIEFDTGRDGPIFVDAEGVTVRCVRNANGPSTLPDTGQTVCYDPDGNVLNCDSLFCGGQDGSIVPGCENDERRFVDNGDGTVTDTCTGLMWQQESGDPDPEAGLQDVLWCNALVYAEDLGLGGHSDWRVPDINELASIVDRGRAVDGEGNFAIDPIFSALPNAYWSSTPVAESNPIIGQEAWAIEFAGGSDGPVSVESAGVTVRCVRNANGPSSLPDTGQNVCYDFAGNVVDCAMDSGLCPGLSLPVESGCRNDPDRFVDNGDGTVTDTCTGLMWQQETNISFDWCVALDYAENLTFADHDDWRMPNIRELYSIVDYRRANFIDPAFSVLQNAYWSSTHLFSGPSVAWAISFATGTSGPIDVSLESGVFVRAVRNISTLPDTGQNLCYDGDPDGTIVDCFGPTCPGQDGFHDSGCPYDEDRFVDNLDGTITDSCTGLMWLQETVDADNNGSFDNFNGRWCEAIAFADDLVFPEGEHDDWRLPSLHELQSLVNFGNATNAIHPLFNVTVEAYWSSTPRFGDPNQAWAIEYNNGTTGTIVTFGCPGCGIRILAVRDAP